MHRVGCALIGSRKQKRSEKEEHMIDRHALCEKIKSLHPEAGECGVDVDVEYDDEERSLVVYLRKKERRIKHYLSENDAVDCLAGRQCVALGLELAQYRKPAHG